MLKQLLKISFPFLLGLIILWWMYRGTDWGDFRSYVAHEMHWGWMLFSLLFGVLPQVLRAVRWQQTLKPLGEHPRLRTCTDAVFVSYAASLVVPRIGEVTRCTTLKRMDGTSFSRALGTVVTERIVDMLVMLLFTLVALLTQLRVFLDFFSTTHTSLSGVLSRFTSTGYIVTGLCAVAALGTLWFLARRYTVFRKGHDLLHEMGRGILSLRSVESPARYCLLSLLIWLCYYLHFYLALFAFGLTESIPPLYGLFMFCVGTYAVLVPTPNGAGPWHFAVKTTILIYLTGMVSNSGSIEAEAIMVVLIMHTVQTALVVLLGAVGWADLNFLKRKAPKPIDV